MLHAERNLGQKRGPSYLQCRQALSLSFGYSQLGFQSIPCLEVACSLPNLSQNKTEMPQKAQLGQSELTPLADTRGCSTEETNFVHPATRTRAGFHKANKDLSSWLTEAETKEWRGGCRQPQCLPG